MRSVVRAAIALALAAAVVSATSGPADRIFGPRLLQDNSTETSTATATGTATSSASATATSSSSATGTGSSSATGTGSSSATGTGSSSASGTGSSSATGTGSSSATGTASSSPSASASNSATATATATATGTASSTPSASLANTTSLSPSPSPAVTIDGHVLPTYFSIILSGFLVGFGMFQAFLGYKFFRFTLFFLGFLVTGATIFILAWDHINDANSLWYGLALGVAGGLLVGLVGALIPRIGVFLVGGALGVVVALILNTTVLYRLYPANPAVTLSVSAVALGLLFGGLANLMMRTVVVLSTSFVGAYCTIRGIGYFAGNYPANEWALKDEIANGQTLPIEIYAYFAGMLALGVVGAVTQFMFTAKRRSGEARDEWEQEYDDSEFTLASITGKGKKKRKSSKKGGKKSKKDKKKKDKKSSRKDESLLSDYEYSGADDSYYDDGSGSGTGAYGYDEYANDYEAGNDDGFEMAPVSSSAGAGRGFGGWFGRGSAKPSAAPIEW